MYEMLYKVNQDIEPCVIIINGKLRNIQKVYLQVWMAG
jgi:hypothetical protein